MENLPIPKHLESILQPFDNSNENEVTGKITCSCGSERFKIKIVGDDSFFDIEKVIKVQEILEHFYLIVYVECIKCSKNHLIFDKDFHGWNGFICEIASKHLKRPKLKDWNCPKCKNSNHSVSLTIQSEGKDDFKEEAGDEFDKDDWVEAFSWITINLSCKSCNEINEEWISNETM